MLSVLTTALVQANDNGLGQTPPLGWRSWNLYGGNVNQDLITGIMDGISRKDNVLDGKATSLCDLGYCDVGLDDNWQACGSPHAAPGMHYHDTNGAPIINYDRFPDMRAMTDHAHSLNLTAGWYGNNCICSDHCKFGTEDCEKQIAGDVEALNLFGFDAWKLDGCGGETNLTLVDVYIKKAGKAIMVENCHWGSRVPFEPNPALPPQQGCPWNFYRSSGDVRASFASILGNLGSTDKFHKKNLSYPGCWAYPDMLQVGCKHGPGGKNDPGLTEEETRTHFCAWAIVSSPLTLSHDVNDVVIQDSVWPLISNKRILAVNQAYEGDSGGFFQKSEEMVTHTDAFIEATEGEEPVQVAQAQYLYKPVGNSMVAVLMLNAANTDAVLSAKFADIPFVSCTECHVEDVLTGDDMGVLSGSISANVTAHDVAFVVVSPNKIDAEWYEPLQPRGRLRAD